MEIPAVNKPVKVPKNKKSDSCGCAMGARVMTAAFFISLVFYGWQFHTGVVTLWGLMLRIFAASFIGAGIGKLGGIGIYQLQKHRTQ